MCHIAAAHEARVTASRCFFARGVSVVRLGASGATGWTEWLSVYLPARQIPPIKRSNVVVRCLWTRSPWGPRAEYNAASWIDPCGTPTSPRGHHLHTRGIRLRIERAWCNRGLWRRATTPIRTCRGHILIDEYPHRCCRARTETVRCRSLSSSSSSSSSFRSVSWLIEEGKKEREREEERGLLHPDRNLIARYLFPLPYTASEISWPFLRRVTSVQMHRTSSSSSFLLLLLFFSSSYGIPSSASSRS